MSKKSDCESITHAKLEIRTALNMLDGMAWADDDDLWTLRKSLEAAMSRLQNTESGSHADAAGLRDALVLLGMYENREVLDWGDDGFAKRIAEARKSVAGAIKALECRSVAEPQHKGPLSAGQERDELPTRDELHAVALAAKREVDQWPAWKREIADEIIGRTGTRGPVDVRCATEQESVADAGVAGPTLPGLPPGWEYRWEMRDGLPVCLGIAGRRVIARSVEEAWQIASDAEATGEKSLSQRGGE